MTKEMKSIVISSLAILLGAFVSYAQGESSAAPSGVSERLQVDVRLKHQSFLSEDTQHALTSSIGYRFNDKRCLGLEFGLATGRQRFEIWNDGVSTHSPYLRYYGLPLFLDYTRNSRYDSSSILDCDVRWVFGASAGAVVQYFPKTEYEYSHLVGDDSGEMLTEKTVGHCKALSLLPYVALKMGLEYRGLGGSRLCFGLEAIPFRTGLGIFVGYGF